MNKNTLIIVGALVLIGAGAFLMFNGENDEVEIYIGSAGGPIDEGRVIIQGSAGGPLMQLELIAREREGNPPPPIVYDVERLADYKGLVRSYESVNDEIKMRFYNSVMRLEDETMAEPDTAPVEERIEAIAEATDRKVQAWRDAIEELGN